MIPVATYRLQFNRDFMLRDATGVLDYLRELGVSHAYASPLFQAGPNSTHGYDVCRHGCVHPGLGGETEFERFTARLRELGFGLLLDIVPNHMSASPTNPWWSDVLEHGLRSRYAGFFDIDWESDDPGLRDKVVLPVLEDAYRTVLESGKLRMAVENGRFFIAYHDRRFPIAPESLPESAGARPRQTLATFNGTAGDPRSFAALDALLERQHYRLAHWRTANVNYRRFFDVSGLVALRMELPEVFAATHELLLQWLHDGKLAGLRIDHPDGLRNPKQYLERVQALAAATPAVPAGSQATNTQDDRSLFVVVEKILSPGETLPDDWPVDGTTGYDFLNRANGLFVNASSEAAFDALYRKFTGCRTDFQTIGYQSRKQVLETSFARELESLTRRLQEIAETTPSGSGLTFDALKAALAEVIAAFPVYRTYITEAAAEPAPRDRAVIEAAVTAARRRIANIDSALEFLQCVLLRQSNGEPGIRSTSPAREFVLRFQQLSGAVMAKGLEDTAFYNYNRLISLNEVGGDPGTFGVSVEDFHRANAATAHRWPHTLLATATHDTKRGEDARARINVLSEIPAEWQTAIGRWRQFNRDKKGRISGRPAPKPNDEYLLYQSLLGAWPFGADQPGVLAAFRARAVAFMRKAIREAKANTSWTAPNEAYEQATNAFVERILIEGDGSGFLDDFKRFARRVSSFAQFNSLSQTLLKITSPGVPDFYQGTELWDYSFVDPDNRLPVDYSLRKEMLEGLRARVPGADQTETAAADALATLISDLLRDWPSGCIKLYVIWRALELRHRRREIFDQGGYDPLPASGPKRAHVVAFARAQGDRMIVTVVPRLVAGLTGGMETPPFGVPVWEDTTIALPNRSTGDSFRNIFTGERVDGVERDGCPTLTLKDVLKSFPVALLESTPVAADRSSPPRHGGP